jgi:hypothetical protein
MHSYDIAWKYGILAFPPLVTCRHEILGLGIRVLNCKGSQFITDFPHWKYHTRDGIYPKIPGRTKILSSIENCKSLIIKMM